MARSRLVRTGDFVILDVAARRLDIDIPADELAARTPDAATVNAYAKPLRGWERLYVADRPAGQHRSGPGLPARVVRRPSLSRIPLTEEQTTMPTPIADGRPIRWGILGAGGIADTVSADINLTDGNVVTAVAARDAGRAADLAARRGAARSYGDYAALVNDDEVDVVYVSHDPSAPSRAFAPGDRGR